MSAHAKSKSCFDSLINKAADVFQALSHPLRLSICLELSRAEQSVGQLCAALHQPQHSISQHLALLRRYDLVSARKESRQVFYKIDDPQMVKMLICVQSGLAEMTGEAMPVVPATAATVVRPRPSEAGNFSTVFTSSVKRWSKDGKDI